MRKKSENTTKKRGALLLPVVNEGAEYLTIGYLMRRNVLAYKAPDRNEGYDLICIHPNPTYEPKIKERSKLRIQVKSRYATDSDKGFPVKEKSLNAFDYLIVVFMNIGKFFNKNDGTTGQEDIEFYTLPKEFIKKHHRKGKAGWQKVMLKKHLKDIEPYKNEKGFELIAKDLGVVRPKR